MTTKQMQKMERKIAATFVDAVLKESGEIYTIAVNNGEELIRPARNVFSILRAMSSVDDESLIVFKDGLRFGWARFIHGNDGWDVLADYTTNLEPFMEKVNKISDEMQDDYWSRNDCDQ